MVTAATKIYADPGLAEEITCFATPAPRVLDMMAIFVGFKESRDHTKLSWDEIKSSASLQNAGMNFDGFDFDNFSEVQHKAIEAAAQSPNLGAHSLFAELVRKFMVLVGEYVNSSQGEQQQSGETV